MKDYIPGAEILNEEEEEKNKDEEGNLSFNLFNLVNTI